MDRDEILRVLQAFEDQRLEYVLIGAAAMGFHGLVRTTEDLDIVIRATPENVDRLKRALRQVYPDDPSVDEISQDDLLGDYPAVRYYPPRGELYFDVVTRLGDAVAFETVEASVIDVEGTLIRVATPRALYHLKKGTDRPLDQRDAESLLQNSIQTTTNVPVEKYRSAEEMNAAPVRPRPGNNFDRFIRHNARYRMIAPRVYPRGVFKFRSLEEAQAAREEVTKANVRRLQERRVR